LSDNSASQRTLDELIAYCTVRIEAVNQFGEVSYGTGFMYEFFEDESGSYPALISNKHVIKDAVTGRIFVSLADDQGNLTRDKIIISISNFSKRWLHHPDDDVDLAVMPLGSFYNEFGKRGMRIFHTFVTKEIIPDEQDWKMVKAIEDIVMVGYPIGVWDSVNYLPIVRRGITATQPRIDYKNRKEFLVDVGVFPGSSGSPIFSIIPTGQIWVGPMPPRKPVLLLGIVYGYFPFRVTDDPKILPIPTKDDALLVRDVPINVGAVIKSNLIFDFENLMKEDIKNPSGL